MAYYDYPYIEPDPWYGNYGSNGAYYMREMPMPPRPPMPCPKPPHIPEPKPPMPPPSRCPQPKEDYYTYPENLDEALNLIEKSVMDENRDEKFYECILKMAPADDKPIIEGIMEDERKHSQLFRTIYCELTGHVLPEAPKVEVKCPKVYCEAINEAFHGELEAVRKYSKVLYAMQNRRHINMLVEIITDEQRHADLWNHLYSKNECADKCRPKK